MWLNSNICFPIVHLKVHNGLCLRWFVCVFMCMYWVEGVKGLIFIFNQSYKLKLLKSCMYWTEGVKCMIFIFNKSYKLKLLKS